MNGLGMPDQMALLISAVIIVLGLFGNFLPGLPALPLVYLGCGLCAFEFWVSEPISWQAFAMITGTFVVAQILELTAGFVGARFVGMSWAGFFAAIFGLIIGLILFGIIGAILGPILAIFLAQLIIVRQGAGLAAKTALAFALGTAAGFVIQFIGCLTMIGVLAWARFEQKFPGALEIIFG